MTANDLAALGIYVGVVATANVTADCSADCIQCTPVINDDCECVDCKTV